MSDAQARDDRDPRPPGRVSTIRGIRQIPALTSAVWVSGTLAVVGILIGGSIGRTAAGASVAVIAATPLARVVWLVYRWWQESDTIFIRRGVGLLAVIAGGAILALVRS